MPDVSVVIPARNAAATIGRTLDAIADQDIQGDFEVIVVDDGSEDETVAIAEAAAGPVRVLRQNAVGPGEARNRGARSSHSPVLAFTDADCYPTPGWLRCGLLALREAELVQGRVRADPAALVGPFDHTIWIPTDTGLYETANLFVTREVFDRAGGFEDWLEVRIGKRLGEDVWFGWKARRAGARAAFAADALVHHAVFPRRAREFVRERWRLIYFPDLVRKVPELRNQFLFRRYFLNARSAAFDAAVAGFAAAALCAALLSPLVAPLPLLSTVPYGRWVFARLRELRRSGPRVAAIELCADAVGLVALLLGSIRRRILVV